MFSQLELAFSFLFKHIFISKKSLLNKFWINIWYFCDWKNVKWWSNENMNVLGKIKIEHSLSFQTDLSPTQIIMKCDIWRCFTLAKIRIIAKNYETVWDTFRSFSLNTRKAEFSLPLKRRYGSFWPINF